MRRPEPAKPGGPTGWGLSLLRPLGLFLSCECLGPAGLTGLTCSILQTISQTTSPLPPPSLLPAVGEAFSHHHLSYFWDCKFHGSLSFSKESQGLKPSLSPTHLLTLSCRLHSRRAPTLCSGTARAQPGKAGAGTTWAPVRLSRLRSATLGPPPFAFKNVLCRCFFLPDSVSSCLYVFSDFPNKALGGSQSP